MRKLRLRDDTYFAESHTALGTQRFQLKPKFISNIIFEAIPFYSNLLQSGPHHHKADSSIMDQKLHLGKKTS